jgi:hypothetical protein
MLNKIITKNFPNLKKVVPTQEQEASRTPKRFDQNRTISTENRERILKAVR